MRQINSTVLYQWFNDVWNKDDEQAIEKLMTADALAYGLEGQPKGAEGFKVFYKSFRDQFHDVKIEVEDIICQDNMESARMIVHAIHTETGKKVEVPGICMVRVEDGKIAEAWNNYDFLSMNLQLGLTLSPG